ncbi:MAG TPA: chemotaxis protein CheD [Methanoregulaceae archaeon]|nr:chemotaxis protein CheD [Methanoregulaceae archaeon]
MSEPLLQSDLVIIGIGEHHLGKTPMSSIGLGSCVGLVIHDRDKGIGVLAHIMLPVSQGKQERPGKYADTAVEMMIGELAKAGSNPYSLVAKIAGGASMFKSFSGNLNIGERNVEAIRKLLKERNIPIVGEEVGGDMGRTIVYIPAERGKVTIRKGNNIIIEI